MNASGRGPDATTQADAQLDAQPDGSPEAEHAAAEQREHLARVEYALKTPVAAIKAAATTLLAGEWDAATRDELLELISAQSDRLQEAINATLAAWARGTSAVARSATTEGHEPPLATGDLTIDDPQRLVRVGGQEVRLSRTEYALLRELALRAGQVLTHAQLLERVWGPGYEQEVEFLWVYVRRLRRKIEPDPRHPRYILTVPGVGYRLARL